MREIIVLGAHHDHNNLGDRVSEYDEPRTVRLQVLLEDYENTSGRTERRLAAYELSASGEPSQRIGYLPKDTPRQKGQYLATFHRPEGKRRLESKLSPLKEHAGNERV
jgi:hypothetical protein